MNKRNSLIIIILIVLFLIPDKYTYPIDGYETTGIKRLNRLQLILEGKIKDKPPVAGALKSIKDIKLNYTENKDDIANLIPPVDPALQKEINALFPNLDESYSLTVMEITPSKKARYTQIRKDKTYMPGSVGKLAIVAGLFTELKSLYPESFEKRQTLLKNRLVKAGRWAIPNFHTVPFFDPKTNGFFKRTVQEGDVFSLYEWVDHMLSVSSNAAASIVWKELILMRAFGTKYPVDEKTETAFFETTPKSQLKDLAMSVVNDPLRKIGIAKEEWQLGSFFTKEGKKFVPGEGGSIASPYGLMKYLVALEKGIIVDPQSSLEIKRLMYLTDRRIRYASAPVLDNAAVYFKSGSYYKCTPEPGYECKKYAGNVENYMNSVAIVEHPDGTVYLVALMSNVLRKNSNSDHMTLASRIDKIIRSH